MAKKKEIKEELDVTTPTNNEDLKSKEQEFEDKLPPEVKEKLKAIKDKLETFKDSLVKKFDKYIVGICLLPPKKEENDKPSDKINVLVLVDDTDSKKMSKEELKEKLSSIIVQTASEIDKNIEIQTIILSELWQTCYDGKSEILQTIAVGAPIYDTGMLAAIKISEIHKTMVLKKFEKYIVSYVLAGSLVQGRATKDSDIDVFIVIDDTDVKRMTRAELKDKLRAIIIGMGFDAGQMTGIKNKLNIQVYILTDFWDSIREANPVIFTFLRDGVPFYDRGVFMPWKQLLRLGKIRPSIEAIDMYMSSGDQMLKRVQYKLNEIGMEDIFLAILTPSQAAIMLYGVPPPTPKETPEVLRDIFVKKEKLLEDKYVKTLEKAISLRKDLEHGTKKEVSGKELDELLTESKKYLERIKKLFEQIELMKEEESILHIYETVITMIRDVLALEGITDVKENSLLGLFESNLVSRGRVPERYLRELKEIIQAKKDFDAKKLTKAEVDKVRKTSVEFIKYIIEYVQRRRGREIERGKIRIKHGHKYSEVILLGDIAFIVYDVDKEDKTIEKAKILEDGSLGKTEKATFEEFENYLASIKIPPKAFIKEKIFDNLKDIFGKDVEIQLNSF